MFIHPQPFVSIPHVCVNGVWWILEQAVVFADEAWPRSVSVDAPPNGKISLASAEIPFAMKVGDTIFFAADSQTLSMTLN